MTYSDDPHARCFHLLVEARANFTYHVAMAALQQEHRSTREVLSRRYSEHAIAFERMDRAGDITGLEEEFVRYQETEAIEAEIELAPDPLMWRRAQDSALKYYGAQMTELSSLETERAKLQRRAVEQYPDLNEQLGQIAAVQEALEVINPPTPEPQHVAVRLQPDSVSRQS